MTFSKDYTNPQTISDRGEQIYKEMYQAIYEKQYSGQYVVIDINTRKSYVAMFPEEAISKAKKDAPAGQLHLIKIGAPAAFKVSHFYAGRHRSI